MGIESISSGSAQSSLLASQSASNIEQDDFMMLLITQLQHQDPMNPVESQDFASQLAEFTSLEKLSSIDENVEAGVSADFTVADSISNSMAASMLGKTALIEGNSLKLEDGNAAIDFYIPDGAESLTVQILDESGEMIQTLDLGAQSAGRHTAEWDGLNELDEEMDPAGQYSFQIIATNSDGTVVQATELQREQISGLFFNNGVPTLRAGGNEIALNDIYEIIS